MFEFIIWVVLFIIALAIFLILKYSKKRKLSDSQKKVFLRNLKHISWLHSWKEKIIDYDKLYHMILKWLWYEGSFGEILKIKPEEVYSLNNIWELHKLRNKLVHDFDLLEERVLSKKAMNYEKEVKNLLSSV